MLWEFTPLTKHYDFGFGSMANAFEEASQCVEKAVEQSRFLNWALPVCFLRRHAIELFLKSMVVILERRFGGISGLEEIKVSVQGKLRPLTGIHSVGELYNGLKDRFLLYEEAWRPLCRTEWLDFPPELDAWISEIELADQRGTSFRYPDPRNPEADEAKSMFQETSIDAMLASLVPDSPRGPTVLIADSEEPVEEIYTQNHAVLARELEALRGATTLLSAASFGLRTELAGGR
jgi:hypothetical protein